MKSNINAVPPSPESAEEWVARLSSPDWTEDDRAAFEQWCAQTPDNQRDFERVERLHERVRELSRDAMIAAAAKSARRRRSAGRAARARPVLWSGLAASMAAVALLATLTLREAPMQRYDTRVGERREIRLDDGTRAVLDTDTAIAVRYDGERRALTVERGRVEIDVAQELRRPFVTYAANGTIKDIGTRFQVARQADRVTVTLLEGEVSVATEGSGRAPTVLAPGSQAHYDARGDVAQSPADLDAAHGWTRGELVFKNRPLADLVAEMNRYSNTRIRLAEPGLDAIAVSGVFHAGDQTALIQALERGWSLRAQRVSERDILLHAPQRR